MGVKPYSLLALCHESQSSIDYELPLYCLQNEDTCSRYLLLWNKLSPLEVSNLGRAHLGELISASGRVSWGERKAEGNLTSEGWENLSLECHVPTLFFTRAISVLLEFLTAESLCSKTP